MNSGTAIHDHPTPVLVVTVIVALEAIVALHTLWPRFPAPLFLTFVSAPVGALMWGYATRSTVYLSLGMVIGEIIGYFWIVPPWLTVVCLASSRYDVGGALFVRLFGLSLFPFLFRELRAHDVKGTPVASALSLLVGIGMIGTFSLLQPGSTHTGEKARLRAQDQLGPDFAEYRFFVKDIERISRRGQHTRVKARVIAYPSTLDGGVIEEVTVVWNRPWN